MEAVQNFYEKSERYIVLERIGEGAFGEVRAGTDSYDGKKVALKYVRIIAREQKNRIPKAVFREIESLRQLSSPYVCKLYDVYPSESSLVLVLEYLSSDLSEVINNATNHFPRPVFKSYSMMLMEAISFVHGKGIVHRDIKPSNILLSSSGSLKLGDFGLARIMDDSSLFSFQVATRWYRAPELLYASTSYGFGVDLWAAGAVLAELLLLAPLFPGKNDIDQMFKVFQIMGSPNVETWPSVQALPDYGKVTFPDMSPIDLHVVLPHAHPIDIDFLKRLLQLNPASRPTASELRTDRYFFEHPVPACPSELRPPPRSAMRSHNIMLSAEEVSRMLD